MTGSDFFTISEMITEPIELRMSESTYDCIFDSVFGAGSWQRVARINGHKVVFDNAMSLGEVVIKGEYTPRTKEFTTIQINC